MSHSNERYEKNCLNCNARVHGRFCHICGQENLEPAESVWHLTIHFFNDITHFDGKFFSTLKYLVYKPGFLSREYMAGRRASYLNPVRMYLFTSALFFLIFFNFFTNNTSYIKSSPLYYGLSIDSISKLDSSAFINFSKQFTEDEPRNQAAVIRYFDSIENKVGFHFTDTAYASLEDYHRVLKEGKRKHNWLEQKLITKQINLNTKYNKDGSKIKFEIIEKLKHSFPQILFISLPLFALFLKMVYCRRKHFYYTNHLIFTFHLYIFFFIALLIAIATEILSRKYGVQFLAIIYVPIYLYLFLYTYKAMRNFYQQGRFKTILKYFILLILFAILTSVLTGLFFLLSVFKM